MYKHKIKANDLQNIYFNSRDISVTNSLIQPLNCGKDFEIQIQPEGNRLVLRNCQVEGTIAIDYLEGKFPELALENVHFEHLFVRNSTLLDPKDTKSRSFDFQNVSCLGITIEKSTIGHINSDCLDPIIFQMQESHSGNIEFNDSVFKDFRISKNCSIGNLLTGNSGMGSFEINESKSGKIHLGSSSAQNVTLKKSSINDFEANGTIIAGEILIISSDVSVVTLKSLQLNELKIQFPRKMDVNVSESQINKVTFEKTSLNPESLVSFSNSTIYVLSMVEFSMLGKLYFRSIKKPEGVLFSNKLINEYSKPTIVLSQSSLGKTEFSNCYLGDFVFSYSNSKIIDCFISGGTIPEKKSIKIFKTTEGSEEWHSQMAYLYNQFRKIFEAQGDVYQATKFQVSWAEALEKFLKKKTQIIPTIAGLGALAFLTFIGLAMMISPWFFIASAFIILLFTLRNRYLNEHAQDLYTLMLNKVSNNHGESWIRALLLTLASGAIFYVLLLWSLNLCFNSGEIDYDLFGYYFEFLNPIHRSNFLENKYFGSFPGVAIYLDFIGRLFIGYCIYQFIAAFRKHSKKA